MKGKTKRILHFAAGSAAFMAVASALEIVFFPLKEGSFTAMLLFYLLVNLNVLALAGLAYFLGMSMVELFREWRLKSLGYRFKTKVVAYFLVLTAMPLGLLFLVSSGLGTNYIESFFSPQFRESLEGTIEMAKSLYDGEREKALEVAAYASQGYPPPPGYKVSILNEVPADASAAVREAFTGAPFSEVISTREGDIVRAAVPVGEEAVEGVFVVETALPRAITDNVERIEAAYQNYMKLEAWKTPLKLNYLLLLGFFTIIIIFSALWVSLKIAGWITEPVKSLASATKEVAAGNLKVSVSSSRRDEMGLLIDSFNAMVRQMSQDKESLQKAYQNMENIVGSINSGVISLDEKGIVRDINASACRILNLRREDVVGKFYSGMLSDIQSAELEGLLKSIVLRSFSRVEKELRATIGGATVTLRVSIMGLKGSEGEHLGLLVVVDDLSGVIKAQRALAWQEVARRMAHEIKNPLTPIRLSTERMLKKWQAKDADFDQIFERSTKTIIREVEGLKHLVDEFSKMGKLPEIRKEPTGLSPVLGDAASLFSDFRDLRIEVISPGDLPELQIDREQFKRALVNLIDNARESMRNRGRITLRVEVEEDANRVSIGVEDEGPGIREEDRDRLFQPYFSTKKHGTGLGLVIANKIIADHGGSIRVRENSPRGSIFAIELPIKEV